MYNCNKTIDFFSAVQNFQVRQDTVKNQPETSRVIIQDTIIPSKDTEQKDSVNLNQIQQIDFSAIDSILRKSEEREQQIQEEQRLQQEAIKRWYSRKVDTIEIFYKEFGIAGFPIAEKRDNDQFEQNFLYNIPVVKPEEKQVKQTVFIEDEGTGNFKQNTYQAGNHQIKEIEPKYIPGRIQFDWITILLIGSFILLGWIRLFSKKYLGSLVKSIISYQESNTLYREKNSLMERASFMVNLLFLSNVSVFVIQLKHFWNIEIPGIEDWLFYFIVVGSLVGLYIFRLFTSSFIGYVFLKQQVFTEYFHNVNIFTKNIGLFLFPIVVTLQFLSYQYLSIIVYVGLSIIAFLYGLMVVRSFQIIIRKNVSIYYMILYLCAFEFAPFLIIYKVLLSHS